ncbi:hypothetical protein JJB09_01855 [Rhizobium sp. KVB221]|uniref:Uncharacterized protein n=1 Tax=Rhizobium setariae TaxID=2801340 RepID=A0A937CN51_9HYPH|nr:hypothetical protein [Rhizobium setariae]MBL0370763.1 hypothetical protein [Rhizobium setariae]
MTVKISVELTERQIALAEEQMRFLGHDTLSSYFAALIEGKAADADAASAIRSRMEVPDENWLNQEEFWKGYDERRETRTKK